MDIEVRPYTEADIEDAVTIWNQIVEEGMAFPQEEFLTVENGNSFFTSQSYTAIACDKISGCAVGLYILHPNNVGRCGHISNTSYAVHRGFRGQGVGEALVKDSLAKAAGLGFRLLQFNAVVKNNVSALKLYDKLGFTVIGQVPKGFRLKDGTFEDIVLLYHEL